MNINIIETPSEITYDLNLTMTKREVRALITVLHNVGGKPYGPRGVLSELYDALEAQKIVPGRLKRGGSLIFPDTWEKFEEEEATI